jgi:hypothetical protein
MKLQALEARVAAQADSLHQTELAERLAQDQVQKLSAELNAAVSGFLAPSSWHRVVGTECTHARTRARTHARTHARTRANQPV